MGTLTLADFQDEVLAGLGNRTENDRTITPDRITRRLNIAQQRIARAYDFSEMANVSIQSLSFTQNPAVDKFLTPPSNTKTIHSFVLLDTSAGLSSMGQSRKVTEKPWRWFDKRFPAPEWLPPSWPEIYARWGNVIVMVPAPFLQFQALLRYTAYPLAFTGDPSQSSQFENKDDVLINYTLAYSFKLLGRADRAAYFEGIAKEQLDEAIDKDDTRPDIEVSRDVSGMSGGTNDGPYWANPWIDRAPA